MISCFRSISFKQKNKTDSIFMICVVVVIFSRLYNLFFYVAPLYKNIAPLYKMSFSSSKALCFKDLVKSLHCD